MTILNNPIYKNKKIFCLDPWSDFAPATLPFLKNKVVIYDIYNQDRFSAKSLRSQIKFNLGKFNPDEFYPFLEKDSLLITTGVFIEHEINNPNLIFNKNTGVLDFKGKKHKTFYKTSMSLSTLWFFIYLNDFILYPVQFFGNKHVISMKSILLPLT